jgi:5-methylcytosine-specific restriction endonuclease McrA
MAETILKKNDRQAKPSVVSREIESSESRAIPESNRTFIWQRDEGRCTYRDSETERVCGSDYALQLDHLDPYALGGSHEPANLRLLCRAHNLR